MKIGVKALLSNINYLFIQNTTWNLSDKPLNLTI